MSGNLWKYYLEDDVDSFVATLHAQKGGASGQTHGYTVGPGVAGDATSPTATFNARNASGRAASFGKQLNTQVADTRLSKTEINRKDTKGLTLLHHAASSQNTNAKAYALALLAHPLIDIHTQDLENGWTALHRAFYFGNITIARAIIDCEAQQLGGKSSGAIFGGVQALMKIKDREGLGPYDLLSTTVVDRTGLLRAADYDSSASGSDEHDVRDGSPGRESDSTRSGAIVDPIVNSKGDQLFSFGSNKNLTLGFGDEDDRQFPAQVKLRRPHHLFNRFYRHDVEKRASETEKANVAYSNKLREQLAVPKQVSDLPSVIRSKPLTIQDVQMAKFHTAVLTNDPVSNLYICGHGLGGRLGTGSERTQFNYACVEDFGPSREKIVAVALGQDHSLAVTDRGEIFSWGSNIHGQLGCGLSKENAKPEECVQLLPKQLFGPLKRETIVGVAASRIHSVAHTTTDLFTFGKNEGQLGLVDSQAANLKVQSIPRQVQASRISCPIYSVSAIDRATICLFENREVHVFANYGAVKLSFPLSGFSNYFLKGSSRTHEPVRASSKICKITSGGDTICALASTGEIFTVTVGQVIDPGSSGAGSTTNPNKIRAALSAPHRAWALRSDRMLAKDVGVDADGSIILSTASGGVFRRVRRVRAVEGGPRSQGDSKAKTFKFMRVPDLTRVVAVRASASGAYAAIRQDCDITKSELFVPPPTLPRDMFGLLSFKSLASDVDATNPAPAFWQRPTELSKLVARLSSADMIERDLASAFKKLGSGTGHDMFLATSTSTLKIPVHRSILAARCVSLRTALRFYQHSRAYENDCFSINQSDDGRPIVTFPGHDLLTMVELALYLYTDGLVGFWQYTRRSSELARRYRQVCKDLTKIALRLGLQNLESACRRMINRPISSLCTDMELALLDPTFFEDGDALVQLSDGEVLVHSALMAARCPFFERLFKGHADGLWLSNRRNTSSSQDDIVEVDLSHMELHVFKLVLRHVYADTGEGLFDEVVTEDLDEFLDLVMDVLSAANELMLDRLSHTCQTVIGRHVNARNVCQLLNAVAPSSIVDFKASTLEYMCLNLESLLCNHWLDDLDDDLMSELDDVVRDNQLAGLPFSKSAQAEMYLHEMYPELAGMLDRSRQAKIDAIALQGKFPDALTPLSKSKPSPSLRGITARGHASPSLAAKTQSIVPEQSVPPLPELELLPEPAQSDSRAINELPDSSSSSTAPIPTTERPWGSSPTASGKLDLKEMLEQASSSRTSNISLGLLSQAGGAPRNATSSTPRMSQKERKKQQQQRSEPSPKNVDVSDSPSSSPAPSTPWKTVPTTRQTSFGSPGPTSNSIKRQASPRISRSPAAPQLTMRQTVAHAPALKAKESLPAPQTPPQQQPKQRTPRNVAQTPVTTTATSKESSAAPSSGSSAIPIQSIRHQARPDESPSFYMHQSLADIISREQADKATIKEAAAKRSLQEIQEEQAFQEWWDQESKAVQEAASAPSTSNSRGRGGRSRGRSRRKGKERAEHGEKQEDNPAP